ncbi:M16 family metallopeptidase [Marinicella gelatinilytica]|uniref:M16 family metallopeptidase n=1 Tax=Marinicella gelatinilytica TaxID=2996017 RepID=UPI0022609CBE|nr:pitrilysin family protein [Marinicella gelatinilytica]MCX7545464.1 pitrilysin family protein [Marinicella gelatinilytica]
MSLSKIPFILLLALLTACSQPQEIKPITEDQSANGINLELDYQMFTLDNGLKVIIHEDHSDPIVAIATIVHVGSNREKPGRTGFAHFFEHMSFNNSENVPMGANRKMIPELGGTRNGGTWSDGTMYYEVVPKDAFEKLMWIDSDRFGYMINTVKQGTLEREKQVVKNEKRQRVDNRAYGHTSHVIKKALFPKSHPYNWTVIGDLEDLQNATLADVREFYDEYYTPGNATLVIAGDIDFATAKASVEKWFGEIPAGQQAVALDPMPVNLDKNKRLYHEDNFAKLPELRLTFPTVEQYHNDAYALDALGEILAVGQQSPLFSTLVKESKLAAEVSAYNRSEELAGTFTMRVRGHEGVDLDAAFEVLRNALADFEKKGVRATDLEKIKARQETAFYNGISSVLNKAFQLGIYNEYAGDPAFYKQDIANIKAVTAGDVMRVYHQYIKDKPAIITSFVPKGQVELALADSKKADVVEEQIVAGQEPEFTEEDSDDFVITPSQHDRSEPPLGELPPLKSPTIWQAHSDHGMAVAGIEHDEVPLVNFTLRINGGQMLDQSDKVGTANLLAQMLEEGTKHKTAAEFEDAIGLLGSGIHVSAGSTAITVSGSSLARNFAKTMDLVTEMLLQPRFDAVDFERIKNNTLTDITAAYGNPNSIAQKVFFRQLYGPDHVAGQPSVGTLDSVKNIELADVKEWYRNNLSAQLMQFNVVGAIDKSTVMGAIQKLDKQLPNQAIDLDYLPANAPASTPQLYFVDVPAAKQSVLIVGKQLPVGTDPDFAAIDIVNNRLGSGSSARLTQMLRITKGYTYGAYSYPSRSEYYPSAFVAATQVRSNVTLESLEILKDLIGNYAKTFTTDDLATTKNLLSKGNTRRFETLGQLLSGLNEVTRFDLGNDFLEREQAVLNNMTLADAHNYINQYLDEQDMIYVVVGDAKTQLSRLKDLGYGEPIVLDRDGNAMK